MIEPIVMNQNFERIKQIDDYSSLIWTTRYYECGDFEIVLPVTEEYNEIIIKGNYLVRDDDEHVGIIEDITIDSPEDNAERMIVTGRFAESILARRIIGEQTQLYGTISAGISTLVYDNIINPDITERKISNFSVLASDFPDRLEAQYTGKNLLDVIVDICKTTHTGFGVRLTEDNVFQFYLYKGTDRSYEQNENPYVIFSDEYDNLQSSQYTRNSSEMVTDVLVAGEGEGQDHDLDEPPGYVRGQVGREHLGVGAGDVHVAALGVHQGRDGLLPALHVLDLVQDDVLGSGSADPPDEDPVEVLPVLYVAVLEGLEVYPDYVVRFDAVGDELVAVHIQ